MIITFTRQLYVLMKAGIPLLKSLQIVQQQLPEGKFKDNIAMIIQEIQEGKTFSQALSLAPNFFSSFYINMIKAAEISGNLVGILKELSQHLIQSQRITRQVQSAIMYPVFVLTVAFLILIALLIFILPVFVRIFQDLGGQLPASTLFLIAMSKFIQQWGGLFLLLLILLIVVIIILSRQQHGSYILNTISWHIPLF